MPTLNIHSLRIQQYPFDFDEGDAASETFCLFITQKVPTGDTEPTRPTITGFTYRDSATGRNEPDADRMDSYVRRYSYNPTWEPTVVRVADASLPYVPPDNEATFEYKDERDTAMSMTSIIYFTVA